MSPNRVMAAVTGEVVADLAAARAPGLDLAPYSVARFSTASLRARRPGGPCRRWQSPLDKW